MSIVPAAPKLTVESKERVPLVEVRVPLLITRESFSVRSDDQVRSFSPEASRVSASLTVNPIDVVRA